MWYETLLSRGLIPENIIRRYIKRKLQARINKDPVGQERNLYLNRFYRILQDSPIAIQTQNPNIQHYEVPSEFFQLLLGPYLKYSCCLYNNITDPENLQTAEVNMLKLTAQRAQIVDGDEILDLGCGWGSLSIYLAENYPNSKITAFSNSETQKTFIETRVKNLKLDNLTVIKNDISTFEKDWKFDKIISIEMFEHMRNYGMLFDKLCNWINEDGKLFVHIFARRGVPYLFEIEDETNFMAKYFFSGGIMPNEKTILNFANNIHLENEWTINGIQYSLTLESWLARMKKSKSKVLQILENTYHNQATKWWNYWKLFFIINAELFAYNNGNEWLVKHYLFSKKSFK